MVTIIELIDLLRQELKNNGNLDVKIFNDYENMAGYSDFTISHENDIVDIGNCEYVPVPILLIKREEK